MRAWGSKKRLVTIKGILKGGTAKKDALSFKGISEEAEQKKRFLAL